MITLTDLPIVRCETLLRQVASDLGRQLPTLSIEQWHAPTAIAGWKVKDIVSHVVHTCLGRLSMHRDNYHHPGPKASCDTWQQLVAQIETMMDKWVEATAFLSPALLTWLFNDITTRLADYMQTLDPLGPACFGVSWAGENRSLVWFDHAREFTEHWVHSRQIHEALGLPTAQLDAHTDLVIEIFMRAVPVGLAGVIQQDGYVVTLSCEVSPNRPFAAVMENGRWRIGRLAPEFSGTIGTEITIAPDIAWRLFTNNFERSLSAIRYSGDASVAAAIVQTRAILG